MATFDTGTRMLDVHLKILVMQVLTAFKNRSDGLDAWIPHTSCNGLRKSWDAIYYTKISVCITVQLYFEYHPPVSPQSKISPPPDSDTYALDHCPLHPTLTQIPLTSCPTCRVFDFGDTRSNVLRDNRCVLRRIQSFRSLLVDDMYRLCSITRGG